VVDLDGYFAVPATGGLNFHTVAPCRVVDTRNADGPLGGPIMSGNTSRIFPLNTSGCGLADSAGAYSLNMAVQPSGPLGYLTTWPTGQAQPLVATLTALKGLVIANAALVPTGTNGSVNVYVTDATQVIIDTNGFFGQITEDRTAMITAAVAQFTVDNPAGILVGDMVSGRPSTVNNLIVSAGGSTLNVPKTAMVAVGEIVTGSDAATGVSVIAAGSVVTAISPFNATSNTVTLNNPTTGSSANASVTFNAVSLFPLGTTVVNPPPNAAGVVHVSAAPTGTSQPAGVTVRFTRP
jgi:hypothetical protein